MLGLHRGEPAVEITDGGDGATQRIALLSALGRTLRRALLGLDDEGAIYEHACRIAVETGRFRYAWIGLPDLERDVVRPVAEAGQGDGYADRITISLKQDAASLGPTSAALREHRTVVCADIEGDPRMAPWRDEALARGFRSSGAFPFRRGGVSAGTLNVYAAEPGFADPLEQYILEGIAEDLGIALDRLDHEHARSDYEARLVASERRHRAIFEEASDGIFVFDADDRLVDVNPAGCALLGYTRAELVRGPADGAPDPIALIAPAPGEAGDVGPLGVSVPYVAERHLRRKSGAAIDVEIRGVRLPDGTTQAVVRDVSERRRKLDERAATERMAALGRLAQGVGHEINNPLAYLVLSLELARDHLRTLPPEVREPVETSLGHAQDGATRITRIVRSLASFGRGDADNVGPASLARAIDAAVLLTANRVKHVASLEVRVDAAPPVLANEFQLTQVFVNLLLNAVDAMEEAPRRGHRITIEASLDDRGRVVVSVADTGTGIPADVRDRVFDPFFTTKAIGRGTGLGLSVSRSLVAAFGGTLDVAPSDGPGAVFRVTLPVAPAEQASPRAAPAPPVPSRPLRVLIVEDEPLIARNLVRLLKGHEVVVRDTIAGAIEACRQADYDRIVCDLMFPGGSAEPLFDALAAERPTLARRMVFMTGGAFTPGSQAFLERAGQPCLVKPFTGPELLAVLAGLEPSAGS
ncbi:MAG: GAF domain-containing protein [Deltaproteobacteria bacterium]|nr:GAF domain-containing protein [Deltaproteobacteria bacterium]